MKCLRNHRKNKTELLFKAFSSYFWDFHTNLTGNYSSRDDQSRLSLLVVFKVVAVDDVNDQVLNFISDAEFYFLPVFLGAPAAR